MAATFDPTTAPAVTFNARNADAYEQVMGQWSRRLTPLLIRFGGLADGDRVVDVGCGTGSLTFTIPQIATADRRLVGTGRRHVFIATAAEGPPSSPFAISAIASVGCLAH